MLLARLTAFALLLATGPALADAAFDKAAARIKQSFEQDKRMPLEPELYVDNLFVSHNYEPGKTVDTVAFLKGVGKELEAAKKVGISQKVEMTRFLKDGDTVVTTILNTGAAADGKPSRFYIAYFFTVKNGKVAHIETWYDRKGSDDQLQSLSKEMKK